MPILYVHGVSSRMEQGHDKTWEEIKKNLRKYVAPVISKDEKGEGVWIQEAYWGNDSVRFARSIRQSLPNEDRIKKLISKKGSWIKRKIKELMIGGLDFDKDLLVRVLKKAWWLSGYQVTRVTSPLRKNLNEETTLFLGDIFFYLSRRGEIKQLGSITSLLLSKLKEAQKNKEDRGGEPLIVLSHSMGGQLVYDMVSYYLPEMVKMQTPDYEDYQNIYIDFWVAAASQVGLFKEMKVFKEDVASTSTPIPVDFPSKHLGIWWNLWDCTDYLSFTVEPFVKGVFDDMYDSGSPATKAHTAHFTDPDFYKELALHVREAKESGWKRELFMESHNT